MKQTNPYNTSVHISLNIAKECEVKVEMSGVVNCALHVSVNAGARSNVEVTVDRAFNSSIHLRWVYLLKKFTNTYSFIFPLCCAAVSRTL